ncbi:hypothetical protein DPMN_104085 [Dreissena polymorpha]|uniref:Uncharacterized protein n=1 Tax=Dreissena polymorpha TaxID=45954 RepID=A0A9D4H992_DREPO|nr:hypothetical protein DPMN_104085 [Dreissena polymorpha]
MLLVSKKAAGWELSSKDNTTAREGSPDLTPPGNAGTEEQDKNTVRSDLNSQAIPIVLALYLLVNL